MSLLTGDAGYPATLSPKNRAPLTRPKYDFYGPYDSCCLDCQIDTVKRGEFYSVCDDVWEASGVRGYGQMLCITCLESRLGRQLVPSDFSQVPLNHPDYVDRSDLLNTRMGYSPVSEG